MFIALSLGLVLAPFVAAETFHVQVGGTGGKLLFEPEALFAKRGDEVVFHFHPKNHTVTQSSFADPCGPKPGGFDSGYKPVAPETTDLPTYSVTVNDETPLWFYCAQAANTPNSHCGAGMVFSINCGPDGAPNSFTNFKKSALAVGERLKAGGSGSPTYTAPYGGITVPPPAQGQTVTRTITLQSSTWATTYVSYPNSPEPTPAALEGVVHKVIVGGEKLVFDPPRIAAAPRDIIVFEFHQKNHTVTQSAFDDPCRRLANPQGEAIGFDSGFLPSDGTSFPTWNLTVNDTAPIWAYCRQKQPKSHCGSSMVFAINSDESGLRNFTAFAGIAQQLNGTAESASQPTPSSGAVSLRSGSVLALAMTVVGAVVF